MVAYNSLLGKASADYILLVELLVWSQSQIMPTLVLCMLCIMYVCYSYMANSGTKPSLYASSSAKAC